MILRTILMIASGGSQNFLGFRWIEPLLSLSPRAWRRKVALNLIDMSPHYFYQSAENRALSRNDYLEYEFRRNRDSREEIIGSLVRAHLNGSETVLDYGCGPGFLANAVSRFAAHVYGCDISTGVIACAKAVNLAPNTIYCTLENGRIPLGSESVELIYTFAVIQHVEDEVFTRILTEWQRVLRPGGRVLCHVVLNGEGWRSEERWRADKSLRGRARWLFGLHCFSRTPEAFREMVVSAGFSVPQVHSISELAPHLKDDLFRQQLCVFEKPRS
jgi:SAM-dependent methyltransferase